LTVVACIPAYNEEKTIAKILLLTKRLVDEIIVCDDGSTDMTARIAKELGARVVRHERRMGYGAAIQTLFREARKLNVDVLVTLDADGQHDPKEIKSLLAPIELDKADIVIGSRFLEGANSDMPLYRRVGIRFFNKLSRRTKERNFTDSQSGFRAYGRKAVESLGLSENGMGISTEILLKAEEKGLRVVEVPVQVRYEGLETSTFNPLRHGLSVLFAIIRLTVEESPLLFLGVPGMVFLAFGMFFGFWMLHIFTAKGYIETNVALASIAFVLIGLFMIFTAITLYAISRLASRIANK
jgi:glycosyltransferase involved in cell wall biosynthesis